MKAYINQRYIKHSSLILIIFKNHIIIFFFKYSFYAGNSISRTASCLLLLTFAQVQSAR